MPERIKRYQPQIFAFLLYIGLTIVMTWPLAAQLGTHIPGFIGDSFVHLWTFEWVRESLLSGQSPFYTDLLFYPQGTTLIFHNIAWLNIFAWLFLRFFVGSATAYTLVHMGVLTLNGFATFLLAREVTQSERASFIAGMIVAFWPFILSHQDHPNLIFIGWIPLAMIFLRRMFIGGQTKDALLVSVFLILTGITRWQVLIMAAPLVGLYVLFMLFTAKSNRSWHTMKLLLLILMVTSLCLLPLMAPILYSQIMRTNPQDLFVDEQLFATDLLGFIVPSRFHPLWGQQSFAVTWQFSGQSNYIPFLGFSTLILAALGVLGFRRKARFWLLAALFYGILALGPFLYIGGQLTNTPLPYLLIKDWFPVQTIRYPERLNVMLSIPMAVLAGLGVKVLLQNSLLRRHKNVVTLGLCSLIVVEYIIYFPTLELTTPTWYEQVAQETDEFAILDVPMGMRRIFDKQYMYYQLTHQKPIIEGHVSRPPRAAFSFIESIPFLQSIRDKKFPPEDLGDVSNQMHLLDDAGVRYLVLHKKFLRDSHEGAWREWLPVTPVYEDDAIIVYRTGSMILGEDYDLEQVMLEEEGQFQMGVIQSNYAPQQAGSGGWVRTDLWWSSSAPLPEDYNVCLNLVADNEAVTNAHCTQISPNRTTSQWLANEIMRTEHLFQIEPDWDNGDYKLVAVLNNEQGQEIGQEAILGDFLLENLFRTFVEPNPETEINAIWQDIITLAGFDQNVSEESLDLILYWHALEDIDTSYKMFLHLTDADSGELVAQVDYIPQSWVYPTDWWVEGEYIADPISLPVADLPSGNYQVWLGIYDPDTGERLSVLDESGELLTNHSLPLTTIAR